MKARVDKGELRMRRSHYGPLPWSLASPAPEASARFQRWNVILIAILAFLVLGVFVAAKAPHLQRYYSSAPNASLKESDSPASSQHAKAMMATQSENHGRGRSPQMPIKETKSGHHAG